MDGRKGDFGRKIAAHLRGAAQAEVIRGGKGGIWRKTAAHLRGIQAEASALEMFDTLHEGISRQSPQMCEPSHTSWWRR